MRSSSEIITVSKRATKAAGYSWGIAEEVGKNIDVLELIGIAGIENLKSYLSDIKTKTPIGPNVICLLYTSPSPRDGLLSRMPSSA